MLIVTNPEIAALTDAYALIKCIAAHADRPEISVIVNRVASTAQGEATFDKLADVSERFSSCRIHYLGAIPEEPSVSHHRLNQPPLVISHPQCQAAQAILEILSRLEQHDGAVTPQVPDEGDTIARRYRRRLV